jgi:integrase
MPSELVLELKKWRLACPKGEWDLVFPNKWGSAMQEPSVYEQGLRPALRRAGLRAVTLHELRHGYGSILISAGMPIKSVSVSMGHANVMMTLSTYTHLMPGDDAALAATLSTKVFGAPVRGGKFLGTSDENGPESRAAHGTSS